MGPLLPNIEQYQEGLVPSEDLHFGMIVTARKLSPGAFQYIRVCWWHSHFYLPRRIGSVFIRRSPIVYSPPCSLAKRIRAVNVFAPTEMCRVMTHYGSDKGQGWHNYTTVYSALFSALRDRSLRIFELGLGTNDPSLASTMGVNGRPGASLRGWRDLFPRSLVFGADVDRNCLFQENRIQTFYCDQLNGKAIRDLWAQPALQGGMDIIIDDGLHTFEANASFLNSSLEHLRPNGIYVVEDIARDAFERWREQLPTYAARFPDYEFVLAKLPNSSNERDNNLLIIQRRP
jgi:SAM-dependent methyltransferase